MAYPVKSLLFNMGFFISCVSYAQENTENHDLLNAQPNTQLETVVISANRQATWLNDLAVSITPVDHDSINTINATHISEVLAQVPGTWISRGNGQENLTAIRSAVLTGAGSCGAFQTSQDGIPLRAAGFCNVNQLFESNHEQAASIEVIRGPGSVLYGANALHGTINVISQSPTHESSGRVQLETGPHDYKRIKSTVSNGFDHHRIRLNINGTHDGGYKYDSGLAQQKLDVMHEYQGKSTHVSSVLNVTNLNQETAGYIEGFEAYKDDDLKKQNPNPEAFRDANSLRYHSKISWQKNTSQITLTPYYRQTEMAFLMHFLPGAPLEENGQKSIGLQSVYARSINKNVQLLAGIDLEATQAYLRQTQDSILDGDSAFLNATLPQGKQYDFDVDAKLYSSFAQLTHDKTDNQFTAGMRYEYLMFDYENNMDAGRLTESGDACGFGGCRYSRPENREDSFNNTSLQLAWLHRLNEHSQTFINVSRAFRAPQANEIYRLQNDQIVADLNSEKVNSIELAYRSQFAHSSFNLSAYFMDKKDVIFQNSDRENISGGETQHQGIELEGQLSLNQQLTLKLAASYNEHIYTNDVALRGVTVNIKGNYLDTAPKVLGNLQLIWEINNQQTLSAEWVHLGPYYTDESNLNTYDGHDLINLRYKVNIKENWQGSVRLTNVMDTDYAERADYGFGSDRYFVGEPRSVYVSVAYGF